MPSVAQNIAPFSLFSICLGRRHTRAGYTGEMEIQAQTVNNIRMILHYEFRNRQLLVEALSGAGLGMGLNQTAASLDGNKRLAKIGSEILKVIVLDDWYRAGSDQSKLDDHHIGELLTRKQ